MIDEKELDERIAEIRYSRNQSPAECVYLASLYIIREKLFEQSATPDYGYSLAAAPQEDPEPIIEDYGDSEFLLAVRGKVPANAWKIIDELMDNLRVVNPRVYDSVLRKIKEL